MCSYPGYFCLGLFLDRDVVKRLVGGQILKKEWLISIDTWSVLPVYMSVHHMCTWCHWKPEEEGIGFPRTGIVGGCVNENF